MEPSDSKEPPIVLPPLAPITGQPTSPSPFFRDAGQWLDRVMGAESYGAPRVFDLFTLLAVTLAAALLLAGLRLIQPLLLGEMETVAIALGAFVTGIAIFQLALWGGKKPRLSSLVAGPILWILIPVALQLRRPENLLNYYFLVACISTSFLGIPAGYLGGAMVAGVFLVADFFRTNYLRRETAPEPTNDDQVFSDDMDR